MTDHFSYERHSLQLPDNDEPFLTSRAQTWTYGHLYDFTNRLNRRLPSLDNIRKTGAQIVARQTDLTVFSIAACWLLRIPMIPVPDTPKRDQESIPRHPALPLERLLPDDLESKHPAELSYSDLSDHPDAMMAILSTSGSTGHPKHVPLRRRQLLSATRAADRTLVAEPGCSWLLCLPLHHTGGLTVVLRSLLYGRGIYMTPRFNPPDISDLLKQNRSVQVASMVPTMLKRLLDLPEFRTHDRFRAILIGGGPLSPELLKRAANRRIPVIASYGMTETCGQIAARSITRPAEFERTAADPERASTYSVFDTNEASVRSENDNELPCNEAGDLWLRGPQLFDGYLKEFWSPEIKSVDQRTAWPNARPLDRLPHDRTSFDEDGWFKTGDIARMDQRGGLTILARRTDLILSGGENLIPMEIEEALQQLGEIGEAAATGIDDPEWGQIAVALVTVPENRTLDEDKVKRKLRDTLAPFKIPKQIVRVGEIPKTRTGKIDRTRLADLYRSITGSL